MLTARCSILSGVLSPTVTLKGSVSCPTIRLGLLLLIAFALALLPVVAGDHHGATHGVHASVEHTHSTDLEPCMPDHGVAGECAAASGCAFCGVRHHDTGATVVQDRPAFAFFLIVSERGQRPVPDIHPPRPSVAV